jgi:hypothetical protein
MERISDEKSLNYCKLRRKDEKYPTVPHSMVLGETEIAASHFERHFTTERMSCVL